MPAGEHRCRRISASSSIGCGRRGELVDLHQPVDIRHIATLVDQAKTALYFHNVIGYDMPVVSGIIRTRERAIMALGCESYRRDRGQADAGDRQADPAEIRQDLADARGGP